MAMITNSEYGIVAVNNTVLSKMIIDSMLSMNDELIPCNKRGKALKRGFFTGYNEYYNSVELSDKEEGITIRIYFLLMPDADSDAAANRLFDRIEDDFTMLCVDKPVRMTASTKGTLRDRSVDPQELELVRTNE